MRSFCSIPHAHRHAARDNTGTIASTHPAHGGPPPPPPARRDGVVDLGAAVERRLRHVEALPPGDGARSDHATSAHCSTAPS
nr:unnamed protein product [Digitaria exilis]